MEVGGDIWFEPFGFENYRDIRVDVDFCLANEILVNENK